MFTREILKTAYHQEFQNHTDLYLRKIFSGETKSGQPQSWLIKLQLVQNCLIFKQLISNGDG